MKKQVANDDLDTDRLTIYTRRAVCESWGAPTAVVNWLNLIGWIRHANQPEISEIGKRPPEIVRWSLSEPSEPPEPPERTGQNNESHRLAISLSVTVRYCSQVVLSDTAIR